MKKVATVRAASLFVLAATIAAPAFGAHALVARLASGAAKTSSGSGCSIVLNYMYDSTAIAPTLENISDCTTNEDDKISKAFDNSTNPTDSAKITALVAGTGQNSVDYLVGEYSLLKELAMLEFRVARQSYPPRPPPATWLF